MSFFEFYDGLNIFEKIKNKLQRKFEDFDFIDEKLIIFVIFSLIRVD